MEDAESEEESSEEESSGSEDEDQKEVSYSSLWNVHIWNICDGADGALSAFRVLSTLTRSFGASNSPLTDNSVKLRRFHFNLSAPLCSSVEFVEALCAQPSFSAMMKS